MRNKIFMYVCFAVVILVLSFADFMDVSPLGVGALIAALVLRLNVPILSLFLVLSGLIKFSWLNLAYNGVAALLLSGVWLLDKKVGLRDLYLVLTAFVAQLGLVIAGIVIKCSMVAVVVSVFLSLVFAFLCYSVGIPIIKNKLKYKLLDSEIISGGIVTVAFAYGLASIPIPFPIVVVAFAVAVLTAAKIFGGGALGLGLCFALGYALSGGVELVGAFALMSLMSLMFIPAPRVLSVLSLIMAFIMYTFFFNVVPDRAWMWLVAIAVGGGAYMAIPKTTIARAVEFFRPNGRKVLRAMINRNRVAVGVKLRSVSDVFAGMSMTMLSDNVSVSDADVNILKEELVGRVCALCRKHEVCAAAGIMANVGTVMECAIDSGRATVAELPDSIKSSCIAIAPLISTSAELAEGFTRRLNELKTLSSAKKMVGSQLRGISDILASLAVKEAEPLRFDEGLERKIAEELTYRAVVTSEALVTGGASPCVMLTVLSETVNKDVIRVVLKKMLGVPFAITKTEKSELSGWTVVYAQTKPKFDVVFSVCGCAKDKSGVSGDTHSFVKIDERRFLMAVCDGMGSGERANEFSAATIGLIENFYKADFGHALVLSSVNSFLSLSAEEIYSAVDIVVVDLESGTCDIIKIGSPTSFIKTKDSVLRVEGESLPIGVLEEMKPTIVSYPLKGGETVVITTDGAVDSYPPDGLADVINNGSKLPDELCKTVVNGAIKNTGAPCDDITVAAFHIFESM